MVVRWLGGDVRYWLERRDAIEDLDYQAELTGLAIGDASPTWPPADLLALPPWGGTYQGTAGVRLPFLQPERTEISIAGPCPT